MTAWLILSHNDADGIVTAAILAHALGQTSGVELSEIAIGCFGHGHGGVWSDFPRAVRDGRVPGWPHSTLPEAVAVLDLPAIALPAGTRAIFVDHHRSWASRLPGNPEDAMADLRIERRLVDPDAPAAATLLAKALKAEGVQVPDHLWEAAVLAEMTDVLDFRDPEECLRYRDYLPAKLMHLPLMLSEGACTDVARRMAEGQTVEEALRPHENPGLYHEMDETLELVAKAVVEPVPGVAFLDWTEPPLNDRPPLRFAAEFHVRHARFTIQVEHALERGQALLRVGRSPWLAPRESDPDLGAILGEFGGGGHLYAAGCQVDPGPDESLNHTEITRILDRLLGELALHTR